MAGEILHPKDDPTVLTVSELAELLRVHPTTIREQVKRGVFPIRALQIGSRLRFSRAAVDRYIAGPADPSGGTFT